MQRLLDAVRDTAASACATAIAQPQSNDSPPLIAGRVSLAEGDAQIWRAEEDADGDWDVAQINDVVTVGTGLYTGSNGRTEFRVGPNTYRLSAGKPWRFQPARLRRRRVQSRIRVAECFARAAARRRSIFGNRRRHSHRPRGTWTLSDRRRRKWRSGSVHGVQRPGQCA